jgi:hypothetical protein
MEHNIVKLVQDFKRSQQEMMAKLKQDGEAELKIVFKSIFDKHPGLKAFAYIGWTMGFNDGEPCYHSGYSYVGDFSIARRSWRNNEPYWTADCCEESGWEELESLFLDEDADLEDTDTPLDFTNKDCTTLEQAKKDVEELSDIVELVYDTNYLIKVSLNEDGSVNMEVDDYDCGY